MVDIDTPEPPDILRMRGLLYLSGVWEYKIHYETSPSGTGWHVIVRLPVAISDMAIICLQAILGSDPVREAFNYHRFSDAAMPQEWRAFSNVLFG